MLYNKEKRKGKNKDILYMHRHTHTRINHTLFSEFLGDKYLFVSKFCFKKCHNNNLSISQSTGRKLKLGY